MLQFVKSLGSKLVRLDLKIPVNLPESVTVEVLRELINKPYLCEVEVKLDEGFTGKSEFLYGKLQEFCKRRALTVLKLKWLLSRTDLLKKFGDRHHEVIDILL